MPSPERILNHPGPILLPILHGAGVGIAVVTGEIGIEVLDWTRSGV